MFSHFAYLCPSFVERLVQNLALLGAFCLSNWPGFMGTNAMVSLPFKCGKPNPILRVTLLLRCCFCSVWPFCHVLVVANCWVFGFDNLAYLGFSII